MCYYHLDLSWANKWLIDWLIDWKAKQNNRNNVVNDARLKYYFEYLYCRFCQNLKETLKTWKRDKTKTT